MKIRNILYGYQCVDGKIEFHPQESAVMKEIFQAYTEGKSLLELSKWLNERQIEYMPGVVGWNKSRIMRLLEDKRYLGDDRYPALIDQSTYNTVQEMKYNRCDQKNVDRQADIFQIDIPVRCPNCNGLMKRKVDIRRTDSTRWRCQNPECRASVAKKDESLFDEMTELLNTAIANPETITIPTEEEIESSTELRRLNNEITRAFDSIQIDRTAVREMMIRYASMKYAELDSAVYRAQRLKDIFSTSQPLTSFSVEFLHSTTDEIMLYTDGTIGLILENGQEIRKGADYASNRS